MSNTITFLGRITSNGRVVIPNEVREALDLHDGDLIEIQIVRVVKRREVKVDG